MRDQSLVISRRHHDDHGSPVFVGSNGQPLYMTGAWIAANQSFLPFRVARYRKLCAMITEEKNKYVGLKQIASQTTTELTEQIKVLENETEIQRTIVINKGRCVHSFRRASMLLQ